MNWLAIIVAAISTFMVGWVWYGMLFKNSWMAATGMTDERQKEGNMPLIFGLSFVFAVMAATMLQNFVFHEGQPEFHTFKHGAFHGLLMSLFIVLPTLGTNALYEQKGWKYIMINVGYWAVSFAIMGGILNIWR